MKGADSTIIKKALVDIVLLLSENMLSHAFNNYGNTKPHLKDLQNKINTTFTADYLAAYDGGNNTFATLNDRFDKFAQEFKGLNTPENIKNAEVAELMDKMIGNLQLLVEKQELIRRVYLDNIL